MKIIVKGKRLIAGIMACLMVLLSVDSGCITALAAQIQELTAAETMPTGYASLESIAIDMDDFTGEVYDYQTIADMQTYSAIYNNEWDKYSTNYFYNQLDDEWKAVWEATDALCLSYLTSDVDATSVATWGYYMDMITLPENTLMADGEKFINLFMASNPQYYFLESSILHYPSDGNIYMLAFWLGVYDGFADGEARATETAKFKSAIDTILDEEKIAALDSESEKLQYVHDAIANKVEYNYDILDDYGYVIAEKEESACTQSPYSTLCLDTTVCAGYAEALQLLCNGLDIDALVVTSSDHMWNKVRINDSWYNVDCTWADTGKDSDGVNRPIYYGYYGRNDEFYSSLSSHTEESIWDGYLPECIKDTNPTGYYEPGEFYLPDTTLPTPDIQMTTEDAQNYTVTFSLDDTYSDAVIYYTTDGTTPSMASTKSYIYEDAFVVAKDTVVKAVAVLDGYYDSEIAERKAISAIENPAIQSHFYQKLTFTWNALGEMVDGYVIHVYNGADNTQIGQSIEISGGDVDFYTYDTKDLTDVSSVYYEIYGYVEDENGNKTVATESAASGQSVVNQLNEALDVNVKWYVTTDGDSQYLVIHVDDSALSSSAEKLGLWYATDENAINLTKNFTLDMSDGFTEFKYSLNEHGVSFAEEGYVFITDITKSTAFQEGGFAVGGAYTEPELEPIEDVTLSSTGETVTLEAVISDTSAMENFNYKYQWYEANDATSEGTAIAGATDAEYVVQIGSFDEEYYYCEVTSEYLTKNVYTTSNGTGHTKVEGALHDNPKITVSPIENYTYTGDEITPAVTVKNALDETLVLGTDYTVSYANNINAGTATVTITFIGAYAGAITDDTATVTFKIEPKKASEETLEFTDVVTDKEYIYCGQEYTPEVTVYDPNRLANLVVDSDYTIAYSGNTNAGTATITIAFMGNYEGTVYLHFTITPKSSDRVEVATITDQTFNGQAIVPALTIKDIDTGNSLVVDTDYKVSCVNNTHVGTADVTITFMGNYTGTKTATFKIVQLDASHLSITAIDDQEYTGSEIKPALEVVYRNGDYVTVLTKETDYEVTYTDNTACGPAKVTLTFRGDYTGSREVYFNIVPRSAENLTYGELEEFTYDGTAHEPKPVIKNGDITLVEDTDYTLEYQDNINASTSETMAKVIVTFKGNYTGTKELEFQTKPKSATNCTVTLEELSDYTYTGEELRPGVIVKDGDILLVEDTEDVRGDYAVTYTNNVNAGEATVTIDFVNNYDGQASQTFTIERKPITADEIEIVAIDNQTYNGTAIIPELVVKETVTGNVLRAEYDYTVEGSDNIYVGTATLKVSITLNGNYIYDGEALETTFEIVPRDAENVTISPIPEQTYTGKEIKPALEVKDGDILLVEGQDYTVEYQDNINVGTATVIISFTGNFTGDSMTTTFTIIDPVPTSITSSVFTVSQTNSYISKITVGTTVNTLWSNLNEKDYVAIYDKNGSVVTGATTLATGMTARIMDEGTAVKRYTVIVTGDTNGDGKINITDMIAVKACTLKKSGLSGAYEKAGDVNGDGKINITDFIKVKATTLKKDTITGVSVN